MPTGQWAEGTGTNGRVPSRGNRKYEIQNIWDSHQEIMRLIICGWKETEIAKHLGVSPEMVSYTKNSTIVKRQLDIMRAARDADSLDVAIEIKKLAPIALQKLEEVLSEDGPPTKMTVDVARDILDRAGFGAPKVIEGRFAHAVLTKDDIEEIKNRAIGTNSVIPKAITDEVVDAVFEECKECKEG